MKKRFILPKKKVANTLIKNKTSVNTVIKNKETKKDLVPLKEVSDVSFELLLTQEIDEKIRYMCSRFPSLEWSGVLFYKHNDETNKKIKDTKLTAIDFYPLDIGSSTYTEFSHSPDFAGFIANNPEYMDMRQGLIHSHNNMQTFFSGTDNNTLREMTPIYKNYLSLIVNNRGETTVGLGVLSEIEGRRIEKTRVYNHEFKTMLVQEDEIEYNKQVVLKYIGEVIREKVQEHLEEFESIVNSLEKRKKEEKLKNQKIGFQRKIGFHSSNYNSHSIKTNEDLYISNYPLEDRDYNDFSGINQNNFIPKDASTSPSIIKDNELFANPTEEDVFNFLYRFVFLDLDKVPFYHDYRSNINYLKINIDKIERNGNSFEKFFDFIDEVFEKLTITEDHDKVVLLNYCQEFLENIDTTNAFFLGDILLDYEDRLMEVPF